MEQVYIT